MKRSDTPGSSALHAVADPLSDFSPEQPSLNQPASMPPVPLGRAAVPPLRVRLAVPPASRTVQAPRASSAPVARPSTASTFGTRQGVWLFVSGAVCGAVLGVIGLYWLTISEPPRPEPVVRVSPERLPMPDPPVPVAESRRHPPVVADTGRVPVLPLIPPAAAPSARQDVRRPADAAPPQPPAAVQPFVGSLQIDSTPQSARVFIDRQAVGVTPLLLTDLVAGSHAIRLEAAGHAPWSSAVRIIADRRTDVAPVLAPALDTTSSLP